MKNVRWLVATLFLISISIPSFADRVSMRGHGGWNKRHRSINVDIPILADINESSKVLSLEFLEYIGEVFLTVVDLNGDVVYEEAIDTQCVSFYTISLDRVTSGSYRIFISESGNYAEGFLNL